MSEPEKPRKAGKRKGGKSRRAGNKNEPVSRPWWLLAALPVGLGALTVALWSPRQVRNEQVAQGNALYGHRDFRGALGAYESAPGNGAPYAGVQLNRGLARYRVTMDGGFSLLPPDAAAPEGVGTAQEELRTAVRGGAGGGAPEDVDPGLRARAEYDLGNTYLSERQWDNAISAYKEALRLAPGWRDAAWNLELARRLKEADEHPPDAGHDASPDSAPPDASDDAQPDGGDGGNDAGDSGPPDGGGDASSEGGGRDGGNDSGGGDGGGGDSATNTPDAGAGDSGAGSDAGPPDGAPPRSMAPLEELDRSSRSLQNELLRRRGVAPVSPDDDR